LLGAVIGVAIDRQTYTAGVVTQLSTVIIHWCHCHAAKVTASTADRFPDILSDRTPPLSLPYPLNCVRASFLAYFGPSRYVLSRRANI